MKPNLPTWALSVVVARASLSETSQWYSYWPLSEMLSRERNFEAGTDRHVGAGVRVRTETGEAVGQHVVGDQDAKTTNGLALPVRGVCRQNVVVGQDGDVAFNTDQDRVEQEVDTDVAADTPNRVVAGAVSSVWPET